MLRQPSDCLLDHLRDVFSISSDNGLLLQSIVEIQMLGFRDSVLQVVVVIGETGVRLDLADAVCLQDSCHRNAMVHQTFVLIDFALPDGSALSVNTHRLSQHLAIFFRERLRYGLFFLKRINYYKVSPLLFQKELTVNKLI